VFFWKVFFFPSFFFNTAALGCDCCTAVLKATRELAQLDHHAEGELGKLERVLHVEVVEGIGGAMHVGVDLAAGPCLGRADGRVASLSPAGVVRASYNFTGLLLGGPWKLVP